MGCGISRVAPAQHFVIKKGVLGQDEAAATDFAKLLLDKWTIDSLYTCFVELDVSGTGKADIDSFYHYFSFTSSAFHDRVFGILDLNGDGFIDFREFVASVCDFGSMDHRNLVRFAFTMFDSDGNGVMTNDELKQMVADIYGRNWETNKMLAQIVNSSDQFDANQDGVLSFEEFCELDKKFPSLLMPAFSMQNRIREKVLGIAHWEKAYRDRARNGPGYTVFDILSAAAAARRDRMAAQEMGEMGTATGARYVPNYIQAGGYVPSVALNPRAKAERRRSMVEAEMAMKAGDKARAKELLVQADLLSQQEQELALELAEAAERENKFAKANNNEEEEELEAQRRGSVAGRRSSQARRSSAVGVQAARRQSQLGNVAGQAGANDAAMTRARRRSSLANAQDRAIAMAMNA